MSLNAPEPEVVYHYTTMETMKKIVCSTSIWATSINYLNDVTEGEYFLKLIRDRIPRYKETHVLEDAKVFDIFLEKNDKRFETRPFVASFSHESDSLPQWRSYCPRGNGVAIGFRTECLRRADIKQQQGSDDADRSSYVPRVQYRQVDYVDDPTMESLNSEIDLAIDTAKEGSTEGVTS